MVGTLTDVTPQKNIQAALLIAKSEAEKANLSKSKFLAAASHDLRQPLTALSLYVDVLTNQNNGDDSGLGKKIQGCVSSLSELLDNLLNVSKLDAGVVVAAKTTFRLSDVLGSLVNIHAAEAAQKGISLHVRCSKLITHTDQTILQRILGNLIANAIRYTDKGGVLVACRRRNGKQWIEVWDSGLGFPSNMAQHIFEEFTQLGDNSRRVGSGLGLAIVGKSAKLLGLELRVNSRPGRGSMFAIEIPQGEVSLIETSTEPETVVDKWNIALVDDNSMVLEATSFALKAIGHQVVVGESELDLFKNLGYQEPDILISDYRLADNKTGLDLILKARVMFGKDLPAILITGDTDPKLIQLFAKHKIKVCYKPLKIDVLNNLISEVMLKS
jgi:CheY-like chemotaxis protein/anti-sigma regulatory factor (Ser/Thr protein kinase)